jgi:hypothetical protein
MLISVEHEATINELKKDAQSVCDEKSSLYHLRVKFPQGAGKALVLKEEVIRTKMGRYKNPKTVNKNRAGAKRLKLFDI